MRKAGFEGILPITHFYVVVPGTRLYDGAVPEQVIRETTGHRSCDRIREYKCASLTLKRKASEILLRSTPKEIEMDVKEKEENLLKNDVKKQTEEMEQMRKSLSRKAERGL